jgi:hypothetical protein
MYPTCAIIIFGCSQGVPDFGRGMVPWLDQGMRVLALTAAARLIPAVVAHIWV